MKRDMDLIREILLQLEDCPAGTPWAAKSLQGVEIKEVVEHVKLLMDAGYVDARVLSEMAMVLRITNAGYEFLESSREKSRWELAKQKAIAASVPATISVMKAILDQIIKERLPSIF
jgi:hypothetical protein